MGEKGSASVDGAALAVLTRMNTVSRSSVERGVSERATGTLVMLTGQVRRRVMKLGSLGGVSLALLVGACAHDAEEPRIRTGNARFNETSVSSPRVTLTLEKDGSWSNLYRRVGDRIERVGYPGPGFIPLHGWVTIEARPNGVTYTPSWLSAPIWTFVTADGNPLPRDLEVPLYFAARLGLGGQWVRLWTGTASNPTEDLVADCGLILFSIKGRHVAGWVGRQGATCPAPVFPPLEAVAELTFDEVWSPPYRPLP